jgi:hypothetical protein
MTTHKFVTFTGRNGEQIIVFPKIMQHKQFADAVTELSFGGMRPISGGFIEDGECVGESISLRMKSRGDEDTTLLKQLKG